MHQRKNVGTKYTANMKTDFVSIKKCLAFGCILGAWMSPSSAVTPSPTIITSTIIPMMMCTAMVFWFLMKLSFFLTALTYLMKW